ncbi:hypothetical protein [Rhizobium sp. Pop5]|uniref:hypothetical protein n=1 Tax=Rhizobium sp. Pop5 TaxID=1223565 RepID=UPI000283BAB5|nr:hypothetical protein RCCGEPOP_04496 [Rhizobium sp. Pop5]
MHFKLPSHNTGTGGAKGEQHIAYPGEAEDIGFGHRADLKFQIARRYDFRSTTLGLMGVRRTFDGAQCVPFMSRDAFKEFEPE